MSNSRYADEDFDSVLASIMQAGAVPQPAPALFPLHKNHAEARAPAKTTLVATQPVYARPLSTRSQGSIPKGRKRRTARLHLKKPVAYGLLAAGLLGTAAYITLSLLSQPANPFTSDLSARITYPLLYPGKLPAGFRIDETSIKQPDDQVIIYAAKNEADTAINISLQPQPQNLNLKPLLDNMQGVREIKAPAGTTYVGVSPQDRLVSYTMTGSVWVIINVAKDTISDQDFDNLIQSLREG